MKTFANQSGKEFLMAIAVCLISLATLYQLAKHIKHVFVSTQDQENLHAFFELF